MKTMKNFVYLTGIFFVLTMLGSSNGTFSMEAPPKSKRRLFSDDSDNQGPQQKIAPATQALMLALLRERTNQNLENQDNFREEREKKDYAEQENKDPKEAHSPPRKKVSFSEPESEERMTPLKGAFTRNYLKLKAQTEAVSPRSRQVIIDEAQELTPYLEAVYVQSFPTDDPENPTPKRTLARHKRKRHYQLNEQEIRQLADEHLPAAYGTIIPQALNYGPIYQRDDLIDFFRQDATGAINLQRMINGLAPIGPDMPSNGVPEPINLHHLVQGVDAGPLAEMTATFHRRETAVLHRGAPGIDDRTDFENFRRAYYQARAFDLMESNHQEIGLY